MRENAHQTNRHGRITGTLIAGVAAAGLLTGHAEGSILFWDSFEYGDERDNIQDVSDWETTSGVLMYDPDMGLTHPGLDEEAGGALQHDFGSGNRGPNHPIDPLDPFTGQPEGTELWMAGLIQLENEDEPGERTRVALETGSVVNTFGFGFEPIVETVDEEEQTVGMEVSVNAWQDDAVGRWNRTGIEVEPGDGQTHLFLLRGVKGSGESPNDSLIEFWFNPEDTSSLAALGTPDWQSDPNDTRWGREEEPPYEEIAVRLSHQSLVDEIRLGSSLDSVIIPEPASLSLLGLGGLVLLGRRRNRQRA